MQAIEVFGLQVPQRSMKRTLQGIASKNSKINCYTTDDIIYRIKKIKQRCQQIWLAEFMVTKFATRFQDYS